MLVEKFLVCDVVVVIGVGDGIGKVVVYCVVKEGVYVVCVDLCFENVECIVKELIDIYGQGIGVLGSGIFVCGLVIVL